MAKKTVVVRRKKAPAAEEPAPKKKSRPSKKFTERAWVRTERSSASCSCEKVRVVLEGTDVVIHGPGWIRENQYVMCGSCGTGIRFAPRMVWETPDGSRYTTREYIREGDSRKVR